MVWLTYGTDLDAFKIPGGCWEVQDVPREMEASGGTMQGCWRVVDLTILLVTMVRLCEGTDLGAVKFQAVPREMEGSGGTVQEGQGSL